MRRPKDKIPEENGGKECFGPAGYTAEEHRMRLSVPRGLYGQPVMVRLDGRWGDYSTSSQKEPLSESVGLRLMARRAFLDFLDGRRNDWGSIFRVMKFQMHAPANEMQFEH